MKVLIVTDSLGLPRPTPERVEPEETWPELLSQHFDVTRFSSGGATIKDLFSQIEYMKMYNPDVVFIQSGIVDCAPRAFSKFENEFINKFRVTRYLSSKFLNKQRIIRLRKTRNTTYSTLAQFEEFIKRFNNSFPKVYWVEIVPANDAYEAVVPGIKRNVERFNKLIKDNAGGRWISTSDFSDSDIMSDHIHLSKTGNYKLFKKVYDIAKKVQSEKGETAIS